MGLIEHNFDGPGQSSTDQAANAAFDAIEGKLTELGEDATRAYAVVMVLVPDGQPRNATVAGHMPGAVSSEDLLEHCVSQLSLVALECGREIRLHPIGN